VGLDARCVAHQLNLVLLAVQHVDLDRKEIINGYCIYSF